MNKDELKKICDIYKKSIVEEDADRYLMMLAMEIERNTRHECVSLAYDLANKLSNLNKLESK